MADAACLRNASAVLKRLCAVAWLCGLAACSTLPVKPPVSATPPVRASLDTFLGRITQASLSSSQPSGFRLVANAAHAFDARLQLIRRAERSIDAQYYYIADDPSGHAFLRELERAAARGVSVRLLVDDLHTADIDPLLRGLAGKPDFQVRLFNPFCCARGGLVQRFAVSLFDFGRLNQRMHNKLLIADGVLAVAGGRNIADDYFDQNADQEFLDLDALMAGDIATQLNTVFARYWDSEAAWPAREILGRLSPDGDRLAAAPDVWPTASQAPAELALRSVDLLGQPPLRDELARGRILLLPGAAYAFADAPDKVLRRDDAYLEEASVRARVEDVLAAATSDVVISNPYLVPGEAGMRTMANLTRQGVHIQVLTNSLATNDSIYAHVGYARYRRSMLAMGVELYELRPMSNLYADEKNEDANDKSAGTLHRTALFLSRLHAKTAVIDGTTVFIGSMNLDPRSSQHNTELGLLIDSAPFAQQVLMAVALARRTSAYRVQFAADGHSLQWTSEDAGAATVLTHEPPPSFSDWLQNLLIEPWIPESLL